MSTGNFTESELQAKRVFELRAILQSINKPVYGSKQQLIEQILAHYDSVPISRREMQIVLL